MSDAPNSPAPRVVAVVGGGVAGVSFCLHLFKRLNEQQLLNPLVVHLFEKGERIGPGER